MREGVRQGALEIASKERRQLSQPYTYIRKNTHTKAQTYTPIYTHRDTHTCTCCIFLIRPVRKSNSVL